MGLNRMDKDGAPNGFDGMRGQLLPFAEFAGFDQPPQGADRRKPAGGPGGAGPLF